jgi:hypothetical protein
MTTYYVNAGVLNGGSLSTTSEFITLNEDSFPGSGSNWFYAFTRPLTGMTSNMYFTYPAQNPAIGQVLTAISVTGETSWQTPIASQPDSTSFVFNTASPITLFSTTASAVIEEVILYVDTPFNGAPTLTVGKSGTPAKYATFSTVNLTAALVVAGQANKYVLSPNFTAQGVEALTATYSAVGATVGAARIVIKFWTPS